MQLVDCQSLTEAIELDNIPHDTTLPKAAQRLLARKAVQSLLGENLAMQIGRRDPFDRSCNSALTLIATANNPSQNRHEQDQT